MQQSGENHWKDLLMMGVSNLTLFVIDSNVTYIKDDNLFWLDESNHVFYYKRKYNKCNGIEFIVNNNILSSL